MDKFIKGKTTKSSWQIERLDPRHVPWYSKKLVQEHLERYDFAVGYCKGKIVVDLGCGSGYGTRSIALKGAKKVYGLDIDPEAISYAQKHYNHKNIEYSMANAEDTGLKKETADVVISFETIEYLTNPKKYLEEIHRILKPNGILLLSIANKQTSYSDNPYHIKKFTLKELDTLLSKFSSKSYYGQRRVNRQIIRFYQRLHKIIKLSYFRLLLHFRPWENYTIHPVNHISRPPYLYLIAVCQKKSNPKLGSSS